MDSSVNWLAEIWEKFSLWASTQPTFVEVAIGVGLFYVVLLIVRAAYRFIAFLISGLFSGRTRFKRKRDTKPQGKTKPITIDDEAPPFIFR
jgi:hypothetical protein